MTWGKQCGDGGTETAPLAVGWETVPRVAPGETSSLIFVWGFHPASGTSGHALVNSATVTAVKIHTPGVPMNAAVDLKHTVFATEGIGQTVFWSLEGTYARTTLTDGKLVSSLAPGSVIKVKATTFVDPTFAVTAKITVGTPVALNVQGN